VGGPTAQDMTAINRSRCAIAYRQDARSGTAPSQALSVVGSNRECAKIKDEHVRESLRDRNGHEH
jgi:hypothetical protein